jgi:hypothetical protein
MPPWLIELLQQHNSKGYVDTLSTLVGGAPKFGMVSNGNQAGKFGADSLGNPTIDLASFLQQDFSKKGGSGYKGYEKLDKNQQLGDYVIAHEYGHMAGSGVKNPSLAERLAEVYTDEDPQESEPFADIFQNVVQFLRGHSTDTKKLKPKHLKVMDVILDEPIYKDHPLKKQKDMTKLLASIADSLKKK